MLRKIFNPQSVAVVGASKNEEKLGFKVLENIVKLGFQGKVYPVNPKEKEILNLQCFSSVVEIKEEIDLAILVVPAEAVSRVLCECGEKEICGVVIISAGFSEISKEGRKREEEIIKTAKKFKITLLGPNSLGFLNPQVSLNASFAKGMPKKGGVGVISQSGAMMVALMDWARKKNLGFSELVSVGNKAGISENEMLDYFLEDEKTQVIAMYLESFKKGEDFFSKLKKVTRKKPVVILKAGESLESQKAILSHTGSLAGSSEAVRAALGQGGALQVETIEDFCNLILFLDKQNGKGGKRVAIVTNAGGPGVVAVDHLKKMDLELAKLSSNFKKKVEGKLPGTVSLKNPIDIVGDAKMERYRTVLENLIWEKEVDNILVLLTAQAMTETEETAQTVVEFSKKSKIAFGASFMGGDDVSKAKDILDAGGVPSFDFPNDAAKIMSWVSRFLENKEKPQKTERKRRDVLEEKEIFVKAKKDKLAQLKVTDAQKLLKSFQIEFQEAFWSKNLLSLQKEAEKLGYPLVLKTADRKVIHKSDEGGVILNIKDEGELEEAYGKLQKNGLAREGLLIQKMAPLGLEMVLGMKRDRDFGPLLMFGLGGIYVEVLKDVAFRLAPISLEEAKEMMKEIKSYRVLEGVRGKDPVDLDFLAQQLVNLGDLALQYKEIEEIDLNPLMVYNVGGKVLDARIMVKIS
jgi:acetyltransferase